MTGCRQCEVLLRLLNDEGLPAAIKKSFGSDAAAGKSSISTLASEELRQMIMRVEIELLREVVHERNAS